MKHLPKSKPVVHVEMEGQVWGPSDSGQPYAQGLPGELLPFSLSILLPETP